MAFYSHFSTAVFSCHTIPFPYLQPSSASILYPFFIYSRLQLPYNTFSFFTAVISCRPIPFFIYSRLQLPYNTFLYLQPSSAAIQYLFLIYSRLQLPYYTFSLFTASSAVIQYLLFIYNRLQLSHNTFSLFTAVFSCHTNTFSLFTAVLSCHSIPFLYLQPSSAVIQYLFFIYSRLQLFINKFFLSVCLSISKKHQHG